MVNTKIRLIIFFAAKDGDTLYSQQKQDLELTLAQIMSSLLQNSDSNWRRENQKVIQVWLKSNLKRYSRNDRMISVLFQGKPFSITVMQAYALTSNTEEAEVELFYEHL